ncbi:MAG TPA: helix-turn-helix transcriptional regulator [Steroidobacteraceae bacterium]|nr:helix-turn-helix transcriptional regulator [Steroidobacteraceae bacterium]
MVEHRAELMTVEAELRVPAATAQLVRFHITEPADNILREEEAYWLDLCLTPRPRNARACYRDRWAPDHFERIGEVFFVPPGEAVHTKSDGGRPQSSILCHLRREAMQAWFGGELDWTDRQLKAGLDIEDANIRALLLRLAQELRHPGFAREVMVELIAAQLAIEVGRYCLSAPESPTLGSLAPWRLKLIDERLRELCEAPTLAELAGLCQLSVRQLTRSFRKSRGCSIGEHVARSRLENAKRLLATEQSVKAIAYSLGFASPSSFSYAFRRAVGETPRQFRQRVSSAGGSCALHLG